MKTQNVGYRDLALNSHFARSHSVGPVSSAHTQQEAIKPGARYCRRLGRTLRNALNRIIRFHELQTIDSYKWLL